MRLRRDGEPSSKRLSSRIFYRVEVKRRPLYMTKEQLGFADEPAAESG